MLTAEVLRTLVVYDEHTGIFKWKQLQNGRTRGAIGSLRKDGYLEVGIQGKLYLLHRLAWLYMTGAWPTGIVDHINQQRTDNRFVNLRDCDHSVNAHNSKTPRNNTSGVKGVTWYKQYGKWRARFVFHGNEILVGYFNDFEVACTELAKARAKLLQSHNTKEH